MRFVCSPKTMAIRVHVFHNGWLIKVSLSPVAFDSYKGRRPRSAEVAFALRIVVEHRGACLRTWNEIYG
jgi:hypothetical protein